MNLLFTSIHRCIADTRSGLPFLEPSPSPAPPRSKPDFSILSGCPKFYQNTKKILEKIKKMSTHSPADQWRVDPCWASALVAENIYFSWKCRDFNWSMQIVNTDGPFNDWLIQQFTEWRHQFISVSMCQSQRIRFREYQKISFRFLIKEILK